MGKKPSVVNVAVAILFAILSLSGCQYPSFFDVPPRHPTAEERATQCKAAAARAYETGIKNIGSAREADARNTSLYLKDVLTHSLHQCAVTHDPASIVQHRPAFAFPSAPFFVTSSHPGYICSSAQCLANSAVYFLSLPEYCVLGALQIFEQSVHGISSNVAGRQARYTIAEGMLDVAFRDPVPTANSCDLVPVQIYERRYLAAGVALFEFDVFHSRTYYTRDQIKAAAKHYLGLPP